MATFRTVGTEFRHESDKVKGSRFLATLVPVDSEAAVEAALKRVRAEFANATHNCWAWRLGRDAERFRYSDDGEPSGSAGRPILQQIDGQDLTNTLVVVTRFYGGTKLGVGGLVRAYGGCAGEALDRAELTTVRILRRIEIRFAYELSNAVQAVLAAADHELVDSDYGAEVVMRLDAPEESADALVTELRERTAGRIEATIEPAPE